MSASSKLLAELIEDAERVALYAQRTGRLKDFELISAIGAVQKLDDPDWSEPAVVGLQVALNRAVQDISPVLLSDLRDPSWNPFDPPKPWYKETRQFFFAIFSLCLLFVTSCSTLDYNRGVNLVEQINRLIEQTPQTEISATARKLITAAKNSDDYFQTVNNLRDIDSQYRSSGEQVRTYVNSVNDSPFARLWRWIIQAVESSLWGQTAIPLPDYIGNVYEVKDYQQTDLCQNTAVANLLTSGDTQSDTANVITQQTAVLCSERIRPSLLYVDDNIPLRYLVKSWLDFWGLILLPGLYGAFGASVFYMRRFLDSTIRNPSFTRVVVRIAMGAFAGVIVTWFWAPNNQLLSGFSSAGLTVFTVAFLVGFGVEVLFVLLDRLVHGSMAIAKGTDSRPSLITPVYVSTDRPEPPADKAKEAAPEDHKPEDVHDAAGPMEGADLRPGEPRPAGA